MERKDKEEKTSTLEDLEVKDFLNLGVVFNDRGEVLLIRRAQQEKGKDGSVLTLAFPGGKQRLSESRADCVKREILDETGYDVEPVREISLRPHPQFSVFIVYHLCRLVSSAPAKKPSEPHEIAEIRWVKPEEIKELITTDIDKKVSQAIGL